MIDEMTSAAAVYATKADAHATCDPRFPYAATTYRVAEHWQTGRFTGNC